MVKMVAQFAAINFVQQEEKTKFFYIVCSRIIEKSIRNIVKCEQHP